MTTLRSAPCSVWEQQARSEKVDALTNVIDAYARSQGVNPYRNAERIARLVSSFERKHWVSLCSAAGVNLPSELTVAAIVRLYLRRAECVAECA
jgi:hypothetical protein